MKGGTNAAVIPLSFSEILAADKDSLQRLLLSRFEEYYFENNMLGEEKAIVEDTLLFGGRGTIADAIVQRCIEGNHSGIFGLRRSGKSSVLRAVERRLEYNQIKYATIESRSFLESIDSWKTALYDIAREIRRVCFGIQQTDGETRSEFTERLQLSSTEEEYAKRPAQCFVEDVKLYTRDISTFVLALDEIELITYVQDKVKVCEQKLKTFILRYYMIQGMEQAGKRVILKNFRSGKGTYISINLKADPQPDVNTCTLADLFKHSSFIMYFSSLKKIIADNWNNLGVAIGNCNVTKAKFEACMEDLNAGRTDADHYDPEDMTCPEGWEISDQTMINFISANRTMEDVFTKLNL